MEAEHLKKVQREVEVVDRDDWDDDLASFRVRDEVEAFRDGRGEWEEDRRVLQAS